MQSIPTASRRLIQDHKSSARWLQIILDFTLVVGLLYLHTWLKGTPFDTQYRALAILTVLLMAVVYNINGVYNFSTSVFDRFVTLARSWAIVLALIVLAGFVTKTSSTYSREVILTWSLTGFLIQLLSYLAVHSLQSRSRAESIPTLVIGTDDLGRYLAKHINNNPWIPDKVVGFVSESSDTSTAEEGVYVVKGYGTTRTVS